VSKTKIVLCIVGALLVHAVIIAFGGILFLGEETVQSSRRDIELLNEDVQKDKDKVDEEEKEVVQPDLKAPSDAPPDPNQVLAAVDTPSDSNDAPALDSASLGALEQALNGGAGGGASDFGGGASLSSGGRIGGTGKAAAAEQEFQGAFSMSEIDQRPRPVHQVAGAYPAEMRARNVEGVVTLIFIVDDTGRVVNPRVEKSSHPQFEAPALAAVRQWKFEPAIKAGQRVSCRMRVPIRFQPS
jgi:protein TonB